MAGLQCSFALKLDNCFFRYSNHGDDRIIKIKITLIQRLCISLFAESICSLAKNPDYTSLFVHK